MDVVGQFVVFVVVVQLRGKCGLSVELVGNVGGWFDGVKDGMSRYQRLVLLGIVDYLVNQIVIVDVFSCYVDQFKMFQVLFFWMYVYVFYNIGFGVQVVFLYYQVVEFVVVEVQFNFVV